MSRRFRRTTKTRTKKPAGPQLPVLPESQIMMHGSIVVAGKDVARYFPLKPTTWVNYDRNVLDAPRDAAIWEAPEKLVFQEVRNITLRRRLVGVYDNKKICSLQTANVVTPLKSAGTPMSLLSLLALLNCD